MDRKRQGASRRAVLAAGAGSGLIGGGAAARPVAAAQFRAEQLQRTIDRYHAFGVKASGGAGDEACGAWLIEELQRIGYRCERQAYDVPAYEGAAPELAVGDTRARLIPQAIVTPTGPGGVRGPLRLAGAPGDRRGAIVLIVLPYARWSTAVGEIERRVRPELAAGAAGVVLVTTGPSGEALALNAPVDRPLFDRPVAILAPNDSAPFVAAALQGRSATLTIAGSAVTRRAFNVVGKLDRRARRALILSTPRSGWFTCTGERGPGVAVWLALAGWAARARLPLDVHLVATSGHEYENAGGEHYIHDLAPKPAATALWLHLGANVAARDWHERTPMRPLPSPDPQRYLLASPELLPAVRRAFVGQAGLEQSYPAELQSAAGELGNVLRAGYAPAIGIFGSHRFHHARSDDLRCASGELALPVAEAFARLLPSLLGRG